MVLHRLVFLMSVLGVVTVLAACPPPGGDGSEGEGEGEGEEEEGAEPLPVEDEAWTYSIVDGAICGNGDPVGVATNRGTSDRLLIYLEGGGACWDAFTCSNGFAFFTSSGITPNVVAQITSLSVGIYSRTDADSPFVSDSYAYVPYCTGDVHAGRNPDPPHGVAHVGANNLAIMLPRILATFPDVNEVVFAGTSAGGYGVAYHAQGLRALLPASTSLSVIMDSSIPLAPFPGAERGVRDQNSAWEPVLCEGCTTANDQYNHVVSALPDVQFGLVQSLGDTTLRQFFSATGVALPRETWAGAVAAFFDLEVDRDNVSVFEIDNDQHVFVYDTDLGTAVVDGVSVGTFFKGVVGDAAAVNARSR
jgi:hypothetical protein